MPNDEMMRPCLPEGWELKEPFDACDFNMDYFEVFRNESDCNYNVYFLGTKIATVDEYADSFPIYRQIITTIADALNAPVLATEEVLAGLPKDANALAVLSGNMCRMKWVEDEDGGYWQIRDGDYYMSVASDDFGDSYFPIKADNCSKTAEYLRQFTLQGVRKETNDV
jgi:hypothetical protein